MPEASGLHSPGKGHASEQRPQLGTGETESLRSVVTALIRRRAAAWYEYCPGPERCDDSDSPKKVNWYRFRRVVNHIQVMRDAVVTVRFKEDGNLGKES